jgi:hypothetical protein
VEADVRAEVGLNGGGQRPVAVVVQADERPARAFENEQVGRGLVADFERARLEA